jgi:GNAT superfamily N-acetyltransferase
MARVAAVRTYLEMKSPGQLAGREAIPEGFVVRQESCDGDLYRALYNGVGGEYHWRDRRAWTDTQVREHVAHPSVSVWVLREGTEPRGFFELLRRDDGSVEIAYFGLLPSGIGRGLGRSLLSVAVTEAWNLKPEASRVWLHTCTLDHPAALPNYLARGFKGTHTEEYTVQL